MLVYFVFVVFFLGPVYGTDCPDNWLAYQGSCYLFGQDDIHFTEAREYCRQHFSKLVQIESDEENRFLLGVISQFKEDHYWLGMTDEIVEGTWRWTSDDSVVEFTDWGPDEPQDAGSGEDCATIVAHLGWVDVGCATGRHALCEQNVNNEIVG